MSAKPPMNRSEVVNAVAIAMQHIIGGLEQYVAEVTSGAPCNLLLVIGAGDVQQYASNVPRETGKAMLVDLLKRWQADIPDVLPEDRFGVTAAFRLMLDELERGPEAERDNARQNLLRYVADLEATARRR